MLGRDVVASLKRWGAADPAGRAMMGFVAEIASPSDRVVTVRMNQPYRLLPELLGKIAPSMACIMPERLASQPANKPVSEVVGSGPFRFVANERVPGSRAVFERFAGYVPRPGGGAPGLTTGPKIVHVDRVEWITMPDPATATAALQAGEIDWWEVPTPDVLPLLRRDRQHDRRGARQDRAWSRCCASTACSRRSTTRRSAAPWPGAADQDEFMQAFSSDPTHVARQGRPVHAGHADGQHGRPGPQAAQPSTRRKRRRSRPPATRASAPSSCSRPTIR